MEEERDETVLSYAMSTFQSVNSADGLLMGGTILGLSTTTDVGILALEYRGEDPPRIPLDRNRRREGEP